jgi:hypothetical protein
LEFRVDFGDDGAPTYTIHNRLDTDLRECRVVKGGQISAVSATLAPGGSATVDAWTELVKYRDTVSSTNDRLVVQSASPKWDGFADGHGQVTCWADSSPVDAHPSVNAERKLEKALLRVLF